MTVLSAMISEYFSFSLRTYFFSMQEMMSAQPTSPEVSLIRALFSVPAERALWDLYPSNSFSAVREHLLFWLHKNSKCISALCCHLRIYCIFTCSHSLQCHFKQFVQILAELRCPTLNDFTGTSDSKTLALILFFFRDFNSISFTLLDGLMRTAVQIRPVNSSTTNNTFSIS